MEATNDGFLLRQHQHGPNCKILSTDGVRYRLQRVKVGGDRAQIIHCPSSYVSKSHCEIYRKDRAYWIKDTGSTNGTYLNGIRITRERELRFEDLIGLGVSHEDSQIDVKQAEYYIFRFLKYRGDLEETPHRNDDSASSHSLSSSEVDKRKQSNVLSKKQGSVRPVPQVTIKCEEDDDIQILCELPVTASSSHKDIPKSIPEHSPPPTKKPRPPAPPPPIISKKPGTKRSAPDSPPYRQTSSATESKKSAFSSEKLQPLQKGYDQFRQEPAAKRMRGMSSSSSSDDSSDGLGDVEPTNKNPTQKLNPGTYSGISSGENDSSTPEESEEDASPKSSFQISEPNSASSYRDKSSVVFQNGRNSSKNKSTTSTPKLTARKSTSPRMSKHSLKKEKEAEALKRPCFVKLSQILRKRKDGIFALSREVGGVFKKSIEKRIENQFQISRQRNNQPKEKLTTDSEKIKTTDKRKKISSESSSSSSSSESESDEDPMIPVRRAERKADQQESIDEETRKVNERKSSPTENQYISPDDNDKDEPNNTDKKIDSSTVNRNPLSKQPAQRCIQLLNHAPTPRFAARAQNKSAPLKLPLPPNTFYNNKSVPSQSKGVYARQENQYLDKEELKQMRIEKLKDIAELQKKESVVDTSKKPRPPTKVKVTNRTRGRSVLESMIGPYEDTESVVGEPPSSSKKTTPQAEESVKPIQSSTNEDNVFAISHLDKSINKHILASSTSGHSMKTAVNLDRTLPPFSFQSVASRSAENISRGILKPGADVILSPPMGVAPVNYREKQKVPGAGSFSKINPPKSILPDEDIYRRICTWRPAWIEEQEKVKEPPPLIQDMVSTNTLSSYENYDAYFRTYYPLLLWEVWSSICNDSAKKHSRSCDSVANHRSTEYSVKIDEIKRPGYCYYLKHKHKNQNQQTRDETWVIVNYHTWTRDSNEIDVKRGLVTVEVNGYLKDSKQKTATVKKFAFAIPNSERYELLDEQAIDCDPRLKRKGGSCSGKGYRFSETIMIKFGTNFTIDIGSIGRINRLSYIVPKTREFRALNELQSAKLFKNIVFPEDIMDPWKSPGSGTSTRRESSISRHLNPEQFSMVEYVTKKVFADDPELMLMHGPPGTGKTTTLVTAVLQVLLESRKKLPSSENRRILICTASNAAIDEIIRRLITAMKLLPGGKPFNIVRVGDGYSKDVEPYSINSKVKSRDDEKSTTKSLRAELETIENEIRDYKERLEDLKKSGNPIQVSAQLSLIREREEKKAKLKYDLNPSGRRRGSKDVNDNKRAEVIKDADIICSTLCASSNSLMKNVFAKMLSMNQKPFLCCIIDEATQTTEPETLLPLVFNVDKLLLVGDPQQLGATVLSSVAEAKGYGQSMFTRLYTVYNRKSTNPVMMLTRQYRMHPEIVRWPNSYCYAQKLQTSYQPPASFLPRPYYFLNLSTGGEQSNKGKIENSDEVAVVKALLETLDDISRDPRNTWTVGIITPYSAQKAVITKQLQNKTFQRLRAIEVDTVDGFQGQEKDIIILSCVRTTGTGFLKSKNRLNVALTRAKHCLYIIGDAICLGQDDMWLCLVNDAAERNCKYDVVSDFAINLPVFKNELSAKLKENAVR